MTQKTFRLIISLLIGLILSGCDSPINIVPSTIIFADGSTVSKLISLGEYTNEVSGDGDGLITYSSDTPEVAGVDSNTGKVTFVAAGTTVIHANKAATATHSEVSN